MINKPYLIAILLFFLTFSFTQLSYAAPPYIDYLYTNIAWPMKSCLADARKTMEFAGLKESGSTGIYELVGVQGDYKGVIACVDSDESGESEFTLFIVTGPNYKKVAQLNKSLKEYWDGL